MAAPDVAPVADGIMHEMGFTSTTEKQAAVEEQAARQQAAQQQAAQQQAMQQQESPGEPPGLTDAPQN